MNTSRDRGTAAAGRDGAAEESSATSVLHRFDDVEFNQLTGELFVGGRQVPLEPRPMRLLAELLHHVNEVVTKDELLQSVWEGRPTVDHVLPNAVSKLRAALGPAGGARLVTLPRVGYRLQGPVQRLDIRQVQHRFEAGQPVPGRPGWVLDKPLGPASRSDVWLARHVQLGQVCVFKFADDGARLAALKREYTLYRVLKQELGPRQDFAAVVDSNFTVAPYFLECDYGGQGLAEWAQSDGRLAAMSRAERVDLFLQIARAVAAAHSVGVLHKDLKPSNVLVDGAPAEPGKPGAWRVQLTDFGSGRLLDPERLAALRLTALGMTQAPAVGDDANSGTLAYMAPELLHGHAATVQSDVYALGLMLFQLVVGDLSRPLAPGWERAIDDELLQQDIARATDGDLGLRWKSVAELVGRLASLQDRHRALAEQRNEAARLEAALAEARRRRARQPWLLASFVSLALGLAISLWNFTQAQQALRLAQQQAQRADAINQFLTRDVLVASQLGRSRSGRAVTMVDVLERASQQAALRFAGLPESEATVRLQLAQTSMKLSNFYAAAADFEKAFALWKDVRPAADPQRLLTQFGLSAALARLERKDDAKAMLADGLRIAGPRLLAERPELAYAAAAAGFSVQSAVGDLKGALAHAATMQELADTQPGFELSDRAEARLLVVEMHYKLDDMDAAARGLEALSKEPFNAEGVGPVLQARALLQRARQEANRSDMVALESLLLKARKLLIDSVGERDFYMGFVATDLSELYNGTRRHREAKRSLAEAAAALAASLGPDHANVHLTEVNAAILELNYGDASVALTELDAQRQWFASRPGKYLQHVVQTIDFNRAIAMRALGRPAQALAIFDEIDASLLSSATWGQDQVFRLKAERGRALIAVKRRAEGLKLWEEAVAGMRVHCYYKADCDRYAAQLAQEKNGAGR